MKFKQDQCESFTRSSNYTVRCLRKGFFCKTSKRYRCPNHAGLSSGPKTKEGKKKSLQNLKQFRNDKSFRTYISDYRQDLRTIDDWEAADKNL